MRKFLSSSEALLKYLQEYSPDAKIDKMIEAIGSAPTFHLLEKLAGQRVNFPSQSTIRRASIAIFVQQELSVLEKDDRPARISELAKLFSLKKSGIRKTFETGKYQDK